MKKQKTIKYAARHRGEKLIIIKREKPVSVVRQRTAAFLSRVAQFVRGPSDVPTSDPYSRSGRYEPQHALSYEYPRAYELLPSIHFCISLIMDYVAALDLEFYIDVNGERVLYEPDENTRNLPWLFDYANIEEDGYTLMEGWAGSLLTNGESFTWKDYLNTTKVQQLWMLNPTTVNPVRGPGRSITSWEIMNGLTPIGMKRFEIVQTRMYNPQFGVRGLSPLSALRVQYETEHASGRYRRSFFERGGVVGGHYSTEFSLDADERKELEEDLSSRGGPERGLDPLILPKALKWERAGLTMQEMQFIENHHLTLGDICRVYKVPMELAGMAQGSTLSKGNITDALLMLHLLAIQPLCKKIETTINHRMLATGEFGSGIEACFSYDSVLPLQEIKLARAKTYMELAGAPTWTRDEVREEEDKEPFGGTASELLVPINMSPESEAAGLGLGSPSDQPPSSTTYGPDDGADQNVESRTRVIDLNHLLASDDADKRAYAQMLRAIIADRGPDALDEVLGAASDVTFSMRAEAIRDWMENTASDILDATNSTTSKLLIDELADVIGSGGSTDDLLAAVDDAFDGRIAQSLRIARTLTTGAYSFASEQGYLQSGVVEKKEWLTAHDDKVRETHAEADGEMVPLDEDFEVGGETLAFPGDPAGSPAEIANCRCTILPVVDEALAESRGLTLARDGVDSVQRDRTRTRYQRKMMVHERRTHRDVKRLLNRQRQRVKAKIIANGGVKQRSYLRIEKESVWGTVPGTIRNRLRPESRPFVATIKPGTTIEEFLNGLAKNGHKP